MNKPASLIFLLSCAALLVHHFFFFYGHFGYDDLHYAELGHQLMQGQFDWDNHYNYRVVPIFLFGLAHQVFGYTAFASALPSLLASAGILFLLYRAFAGGPAWQYLLAVCCYFSLNWNLFFSDKLMPDVFLTLFFSGAWWWYVKARQSEQRTQASRYGFGAGVLLFLAFNTKGTLILAVPLYLLYFLIDLNGIRGGKRLWTVAYWRTFLLTCVGLLLLYFGITYALTGSPWTRFATIDANHYLNDCSYDELPWAHLQARLTSGYWKLFTEGYLFVYALVALAGMVVWPKLRSSERPHVGFYALTIGVVLLSINFMTISPTSYNPVCMEARHYLFLTPPLAVGAVAILTAVFRGLGWDGRAAWPWLVAVPLALFCLRPAYQLAAYGKTLRYREVAADYRQLLDTLPRPVTLYGSAVFRNYGEYYLGFSAGAAGVTLQEYAELPDCNARTSIAGPTLLVRNWYMDWHAEMDDHKVGLLIDSLSLTLRTKPEVSPFFQISEISCQRE